MQAHPKDSLDGKVGAILSSCEHMQIMQETIRTHVQSGPKHSVDSRGKSAGIMTASRRQELKTKLQTMSSEVGKSALTLKKWRHGKDMDIGLATDAYNNPHTMFRSNRNVHAAHLDAGHDVDEEEVFLLKEELKALKTMNNRLLTLLDPKTARGLMEWQKFEHNEKPEENFQSGMCGAIHCDGERRGRNFNVERKFQVKENTT